MALNPRVEDWTGQVVWLVRLAVARAHYHFVMSLSKTRTKRKLLLSKYPISNRNIYSGLVLWDYFALGRKKVNVTFVNNPR